MPFAETYRDPTTIAYANMAAQRKRYGCMAARINSAQRHRLGIDALGRKAGTLVYLDVKDGTRFPAEGEQASWVCYHPACQGKRWETKRELLQAHPENRILTAQQEAHVYVAVCELAAVPAKGDVEAQPAVCMLLSEEE